MSTVPLPSKNQLLQQATERRHIELFLQVARIRAEVELRDRPDCVLVLPSGRVGLEHGELYDQELQAHRPHLQRLEEAVRSGLETRGLRLRVQVDFPGGSSYLVRRPRELRPLARRIVDLASAAGPRLARAPEVAIEADELEAAGIEGPNRIAIRGSDRPSVRTHAGPVDGEDAQRVLEAVRRKESKLSAYAEDARISQLWLLLVTGESLRIETLRIESRFDRVYVLEARARRLLCVRE